MAVSRNCRLRALAKSEGHGTEIILDIKRIPREESYDEYLEPYRLAEIVKKYSGISVTRSRWRCKDSRLKEGVEPKGREERGL